MIRLTSIEIWVGDNTGQAKNIMSPLLSAGNAPAGVVATSTHARRSLGFSPVKSVGHAILLFRREAE